MRWLEDQQQAQVATLADTFDIAIAAEIAGWCRTTVAQAVAGRRARRTGRVEAADSGETAVGTVA